MKSPNEKWPVVHGASCSPRPMSEVGYLLEPGAQEAADKGVFLWGLLISQSISYRADSPNVLVGSWAQQERKQNLIALTCQDRSFAGLSHSTCLGFPRARPSTPGVQVRKLGSSPSLFSRSHCLLECLGGLFPTPPKLNENHLCVFLGASLFNNDSPAIQTNIS